ncbi:MAG: sortase [Candidatus Daviesbacteria bacterium]|nr:sortase [Candidatus Daviesbacteria bacterium]
MNINNFKLVLLVRGVGYFLFLTGFLSLIITFGPLAQAEAGFRMDNFLGIKHTIPKIITSADSPNSPIQNSNQNSAENFGSISTNTEVIKPVSTDFGIVIEKINANSKVIANVNPGNEKEYTAALARGVAHAAGTAFPGEKGNIYLFSHSIDAPWNIIRFNAIFYLLREVEKGDRIVMFYQGKRFDYIVYDKTIADPNDVSYLTNTYDDSVLTLQTCDPPGTLFHRLIVRAKLAGS